MTTTQPTTESRMMTFLDQFNDDTKLKAARARHPHVKRWVGARGTGTTRNYVCYCCDKTIDSESAKHAPTKHAVEAIKTHVCK